jgi:acid phosphatase
MLLSLVVALAIAQTALGATPPPVSTIQPPASEISAIAATATPISPVSDVKGAAFDRFIQIWLENTVSVSTAFLI